jgi:hypothetical protein
VTGPELAQDPAARQYVRGHAEGQHPVVDELGRASSAVGQPGSRGEVLRPQAGGGQHRRGDGRAVVGQLLGQRRPGRRRVVGERHPEARREVDIAAAVRDAG